MFAIGIEGSVADVPRSLSPKARCVPIAPRAQSMHLQADRNPGRRRGAADLDTLAGRRRRARHSVAHRARSDAASAYTAVDRKAGGAVPTAAPRAMPIAGRLGGSTRVRGETA